MEFFFTKSHQLFQSKLFLFREKGKTFEDHFSIASTINACQDHGISNFSTQFEEAYHRHTDLIF